MSVNVSAVPTTTSCPMCKENHVLYLCQRFKSLNPFRRRNNVNRLRLCFNCLKPQHQAQNCPSKACCKMCRARHHTTLHLSPPPQIRSMAIRTRDNQSPVYSSDFPPSAESQVENVSNENNDSVSVNAVLRSS